MNEFFSSSHWSRLTVQLEEGIKSDDWSSVTCKFLLKVSANIGWVATGSLPFALTGLPIFPRNHHHHYVYPRSLCSPCSCSCCTSLDWYPASCSPRREYRHQRELCYSYSLLVRLCDHASSIVCAIQGRPE